MMKMNNKVHNKYMEKVLKAVKLVLFRT